MRKGTEVVKEYTWEPASGSSYPFVQVDQEKPLVRATVPKAALKGNRLVKASGKRNVVCFVDQWSKQRE
jgi:hypothetical protein